MNWKRKLLCFILWSVSWGSFHVWWEALPPRAVCVKAGHRRIETETPCCDLTPSLVQEPRIVLMCTTADREPGWLCAHYSGWREDARSGREAAGWLPRPASSPGPSTALMRARGADGHTQGAKDYCPYPKGAKERILSIKGSREGDQEGHLQSFC